MNDELFWAKVNKTETCWDWIGSLNGGGYGQLGRWINGVKKRFDAHRYSWTMNIGEIPKGMSVLHRCDNRKCVRPEHLFLGTQKDNIKDMHQKKRGFTPFKIKTHCIRGHALTAENRENRKSDGVSICKLCRKSYRKRWREKLALTNPEKLKEFRKKQAKIQRNLRKKHKEKS